MRTLELLAPAKNLETGIAAIDHGADAVYIGAHHFGARASAGNSTEDIAQLCQYAHQFQAKVYVTVNTIIYENELTSTASLLKELEKADVDAILVQDMALLDQNHTSLCLHASTQTDNRTIEKVKWLASKGFKRIVLARELSVEEIREIHEAVPEVELEVFVHGALCVSYSGLCYASQYCFGRSANRGECAQFCRMKFDLIDSQGKIFEKERHLLSLKDMCQLDNLERLAEAGASSFKIEGRLKDVKYVKNVTAAYSRRLDEIVARYPDRYRRASLGRIEYTFQPDLCKTFNRGYTTYFADGRQKNIASFDTPKAIGEYVGKVKEIRDGISFNVAGVARFSNGDGLCFLNKNRELEGLRVNRVEGNRLYPYKMPQSLLPGTMLYRNNDQEFEKVLARPTSVRRRPVSMKLGVTNDGFSLSIEDITITVVADHITAQKPQNENIVRQLTKLGSTNLVCDDVEIPADFNYFIPSSLLSDMRRKAVDEYTKVSSMNSAEASLSAVQVGPNHSSSVSSAPLPRYDKPYCYNIANSKSLAFYRHEGMGSTSMAYEIEPSPEGPIMQCRYCLRYELGGCVKRGGKMKSWIEPLFLKLGDGRLFRLEFDCRNCQMNVYAE